MDIANAGAELELLSRGAGGCAAKLGPTDLSELMSRLSWHSHPDLLVGPEHGSDAGVYQLSPELAMVQSADFFPPMVTDPAAFGRIAAANAMSDIYAMGGRPVTALNLLAIPRDSSPASIAAILEGARSAVEEAGAVIAGGHTIINDSIIFGLAVTGTVHPARLLRNTSAQPGDALVLTKALGTGIVIHAYNAGRTGEAELAATVKSMGTLNRRAGEALFDCGAHASTDITGFGLLTHAIDMVALGQVGIEIDSASLPLLPGALELAADGMICGGTSRNTIHTGQIVDTTAVSEAMNVVLNDAQTSGGLLVALPEERVAEFLERLGEDGGSARRIGRVDSTHPGEVRVL